MDLTIKPNAELIAIYNIAKLNIRHTAEYVNAVKTLNSKLQNRADYADLSPVKMTDLSYGVREALCSDFTAAGYNVHCCEHTALEISLKLS